MSDKIKDNEFEENNIPNPDSDNKPYVPDEVNFEENDNWQFEAKALTLENNDFEEDTASPEAEDTASPEAVDVASPEVNENKKEVQQAKISKEKPAPQKAKKNSKNAVKFAATAVIGAVVIAVLVFFGVRYYTLPNTNEKMNPGNVALTVDKTDVSIGMYNYYYNAVSNNYITYAQQGYYQLDTTKDYAKQKTTDSEGNEVTWAQLFENDTIDRIQYITSYYQEGVKNGVTITDSQKEEIESNIQSIKDAASEADLSIDEYISSTYGDYCGLATVRKLLEQSYIANNYYRQYLIGNKVDKKDVEAYFEEHKDDYTSISFAYLPVVYNVEDEASKTEAEKNAKKYASKISSLKDLKKLIPSACKDIIDEYVSSGQFESADECAEAIAGSVETSITKSDTSFTESALNWLFDEKTKVNDCGYFLDEENSLYFIILKTGEPEIAEEEVYSVRHILITPKSDKAETSEEQEGEAAEKTEFTDEQWKEAEKKAKDILAEYEKGDKSEYSFALLAEEYSDDTESTSNGSSGLYGGLYEGTPLGQMVKSFEEWSTDDSRKYGDTGIVKSDYGYHIMYFVEDTTSILYDCELAVESEKEQEYIKSFEVKKHKGAMKKTMVAKPQTEESATAETAE